jgi:spore coat polysaccharide biosynthesis protein SpsF
MRYATEQEIFWKGEFGDSYTDRNRGSHLVAANLSFFSKVLDRARGIHSVLELGSNAGLNLMALRQLLPSAMLSAVEINEKAALDLKDNLPDIDLHVGSILDFNPGRTWDLVFTKGVLIHVNPDKLAAVYELMCRSSSRYILLAEYYSPKATEIPYRGHAGKLFKRDFAGEMLDVFSDFSLADYGFLYHRDPNFPHDDINWFLLEKNRR